MVKKTTSGQRALIVRVANVDADRRLRQPSRSKSRKRTHTSETAAISLDTHIPHRLIMIMCPLISDSRSCFVTVVGSLMRRMRIQRGLTQRQLAKVSGHTERLIRKGKKGVRLDNTTVQNLAEALSQFGENVSVSSLLQDNPATAELWVQGFDRFGKRRCS